MTELPCGLEIELLLSMFPDDIYIEVTKRKRMNHLVWHGSAEKALRKFKGRMVYMYQKIVHKDRERLVLIFDPK